MKFSTASFGLLISLAVSGAALAGTPAPAPLLASGPVGLAILAAAGAGYLGLRAWRRRR